MKSILIWFLFSFILSAGLMSAYGYSSGKSTFASLVFAVIIAGIIYLYKKAILFWIETKKLIGW